MQISGYRLEFNIQGALGRRVTPFDSLNVCIDTRVPAIDCQGCGVAGSDRRFSVQDDIDIECPYDDISQDLIACYRRDSKVANWEGWIFDTRDCKPYRIVQMPDGYFWMAQNLNFQGTAGNQLTFQPNNLFKNNSLTPATYDDGNGIFWCPGNVTQPYNGMPLLDSLLVERTGDLAACDTYGALYPFMTTIIKNGKSTGTLSATSSDLEQPPVPLDSVNVIQGICPPGWFYPAQVHWGKMFNMVEADYLRNLPVRLDTMYGCDTLRGDNAIKKDG
jgi:hypothetical protein